MQRLALVGGASAGIGKAIAETLVERGFGVIITARGEERLLNVARELQAKSKSPGQAVVPLTSDFASQKSISGLLTKIREGKYSPDVVVLNTGGPKIGKLSELSAEDWDLAHQQQFKSQLALITEFLPAMKKKRWGRVISISSALTLEPTPAMVLSAGYRALLINVLKGISQEVVRDGITFNTICPNAVRSDRLVESLKRRSTGADFDLEKEIQKVGEGLPIGRIAEGREIASLVAYLASDDAAYMTGTVIPVDGGASHRGI